VIDRDSPFPIYRQLAEAFRAKIVSGEYAAGSLLPTERALMAENDMSRVAVRLAMDKLAREGLIVRRRGKGTYVAPERISHDLSGLSGLYEGLGLQGSAETTLLAFGAMRRSKSDESALPYDIVVHGERTYRIEDIPIALARFDLHPRARSISAEQAAEHENHAILTRLLGFTIERAETRIRAQLPDRDVAVALDITESEPVLTLRRVTYATGEIPIERTIVYIRSDRYEFALAVREGQAVDQALQVRTRVDGASRPGLTKTL
jgi:GntR family transcriptional regulator